MAKKLFLLFIPILIFAGCAKRVTNELDDFKRDKLTVSEFTLGPGDVIEVTVWRHDDLNEKVKVDPYGKITYPLVGVIDVNGLSVFTLRDKLFEGLSKYLVAPRVNVSIVSFESHKIYVLGEVRQPGIFSLQRHNTVLEAITMAGGFNQEAKPASIVLIRGGLKRSNAVTLNLKKAIKKGDLEDNVAIQKGDIIYVPPMLIADLSRKFRYLYNILLPIVLLENGIALEPQVESVLTGKSQSRNTTIIIGTGGGGGQ